MSVFSDIPERANGEKVDSSWWNSIRTALISFLSTYTTEIASKADQTDLDTAVADIATNTADIAANASNLTAHEADTSTHGVTGDVVGTSDTQVLSNKEFSDSITFNQVTTPTNPSAGKNKFYPKSDNKFYTLDSDGNEVAVGSGSGGGGALSFIDWGEFEDADSIIKFTAYDDGGAFVDGTGGTVSSSVLAIVGNKSTPLRGTQSLQMQRKADISGLGIGSVDIDIPLGYRGIPVFWSGVTNASSEYVSGDTEVKFYDVTNSAILDAIGTTKILSGTNKFSVVVNMPTSCAKVRVCLHTETDNATANWDLDLDDLIPSPQATAPGAIVTAPQSYTPVFTGLGTVTGISMLWWREGKFLCLLGKFTTGTASATEARVSFPDEASSGADTNAPTIFLAGEVGRGAATTSLLNVLAESGKNYLTFGKQGSSNAGLTKINGSDMSASGETFSINAKIPIKDWEASAMIGTNELVHKTIMVFAAGNGGESITANSTNIPFAETEDKFGVWDGKVYTALYDHALLIEGSIRTTSAIGPTIYSYIERAGDSSFSEGPSLGVANATGQTIHFSGAVKLEKGDKFAIRMSTGATLSNDADKHWLTLFSVPDFSIFSIYFNSSGATTSRPSSPMVGQFYFDTTLGQPVWYDGTDWVDATGTSA